MRTSNTPTLLQLIPRDKNVSNTGSTRITNIQTPADLGNLCVKHRQRTNASDVANKGIGDKHALKERSYTAEDKRKCNTHIFLTMPWQNK